MWLNYFQGIRVGVGMNSSANVQTTLSDLMDQMHRYNVGLQLHETYYSTSVSLYGTFVTPTRNAFCLSHC